jgi:hypothetical protein
MNSLAIVTLGWIDPKILPLLFDGPRRADRQTLITLSTECCDCMNHVR